MTERSSAQKYRLGNRRAPAPHRYFSWSDGKKTSLLTPYLAGRRPGWGHGGNDETDVAPASDDGDRDGSFLRFRGIRARAVDHGISGPNRGKRRYLHRARTGR